MAKRQQEEVLIDTDFEEDKSLIAQAKKYRKKRDERMAVGEEEVAEKEKLIEMMHERQLTVYKYDGMAIELVPSEKVKVKEVDEEPEPEEGDE